MRSTPSARTTFRPAWPGLHSSLAVIGAGSKAGLVPLHVWLPLAHPAAPSHVSALMSGVMTKVAIYAFIRIAFDLMGDPSWWWSLPALLLGGATAAIGVLYALMETDLKRVLAYSTIENVGIIFIATRSGPGLQGQRLGGAAALALTAALFHALNHMLFKSALFFGAGTVIVATGEQDMERLGGLIRRMPISSAAFLAASMAISALPPFNGFASEWLIFQSILVSPQLPQMGLKLLVPAIGVLLALAAALAAACFVRAFGATYLGRARTTAAAEARRSRSAGRSRRWSSALPFACWPAYFPGSSSTGCSRLRPHSWPGICRRRPAFPGYRSCRCRPAAAPTTVCCCSASWRPPPRLAAAAVHRFASRTVRRAPFWDCGYPDLGVVAQYSATSLAQPIRRVFATVVFAAHEQVEMPPPGDRAAGTALRRFLRDPIWDFMYAPIASAVGASATLLNHIQFLTIRRYLSFVFIALVVLLVVLALWG